MKAWPKDMWKDCCAAQWSATRSAGVNTNNNTPAIIHVKIVEGDGLKITVAPKGFGSENMSRIKMFTPAATKEMIMDFVIETVELAGANPCPPMVVGVGNRRRF